MNLDDSVLLRLFKAAARVRPALPMTPSFALETRTLASWRAARFPGDRDVLQRLFRFGLALASAVTLLIVAFSLRAIAKEPAREVALPNVIVNLALSQ